jgi:hypothetical protein
MCEARFALASLAEQKNAKICLPLGITTKSDFVLTRPRPKTDMAVRPAQLASVHSAADETGVRAVAVAEDAQRLQATGVRRAIQ